MKKMGTALALLLIVSGYLWIENSHVKNESQALQAELQAVQDEEDEDVYHGRAGEVSEQFIEGYFNYEGEPVRDNVDAYASDDVLDSLQFDDPAMEDEEMESVRSSVDDLNIYYGDTTEDRQEVVVLFDNVIDLDGTETNAFSLVELDVELMEDEGWQVSDFTFQQL